MSAPHTTPTPARLPAFTLYDPVTDETHALAFHQAADGQVTGHVSSVLTVDGERRPVLVSAALGPLTQLTPEPHYQALAAWLGSVARALSAEAGLEPMPDPGFRRP